ELDATRPDLSVDSPSPGKDHVQQETKHYESNGGIQSNKFSSVPDELRIGLAVGTLAEMKEKHPQPTADYHVRPRQPEPCRESHADQYLSVSNPSTSSGDTQHDNHRASNDYQQDSSETRTEQPSHPVNPEIREREDRILNKQDRRRDPRNVDHCQTPALSAGRDRSVTTPRPRGENNKRNSMPTGVDKGLEERGDNLGFSHQDDLTGQPPQEQLYHWQAPNGLPTRYHPQGPYFISSIEEPLAKEVKLWRCRHRKCCSVCVLVFLFFVIALGIAIYELLKHAGNSSIQFKYSADGRVRLDETYQPSMSDNSSDEFQHFQNKFCYNVEESVKQRIDVLNCTISSMSQGSVIVHFILQFVSSTNMTAEEMRGLLTANKTKGGDRSQLGLLILYPDYTQVYITAEETLDEAIEEEPQSRPSTFDCTKTDKLYLPLPYTSQGFCGEYQRCHNGKSELFSCADGQEFAYTSVGDRTVCAPPSNTTYCGRQREETPTTATSTTEPTDLNTTSSDTTTRLLTTEPTTQNLFSSTESNATEYPCSDLTSVDS
ncbi:hypothetical protein BaRGS_00040465, partial [Batillaria attramentaria]